METVKLSLEDNPLRKLNAADIEEWIHIDDDIEVAATFTDQEIIQSITTPEKIEENCSEESGEEDDKVEEKISWTAAEKGIETVIKFVEQNHSFSLQDVMHAHMHTWCRIILSQRNYKVVNKVIYESI
ncbi:putative Jerky protein-like 58 [Homarus americanus]|uniref:Putative Jerky protein-like 58 n=1 Tax=Homarus americanus TaxID=6706 RepID=A0A8J5MYN2_HOMAM|nr:putative Jerky protein-like 58 [Homarus americanus]